MKLILAQYLRTLKERDEFDRLLPDLLLAMGYVSVSKPQTGPRQHGVDLAAVGVSPEDGTQELLMLIIKRGDIGRADWNSGPQSVRQSLDDVLDVYLETHIEPAHKSFRKRIILATTGDLKQNAQINWDGYTNRHEALATFSFWGGDQIALLLEKYMLNEHIFDTEDRANLRKSLALAGELDYDQKDLYKLFLRQLGLTGDGALSNQAAKPRDLIKALRVVNLAAQIFVHWSGEEGNLKQALAAIERALLWAWHRIHLEEEDDRPRYYQELGELWFGYNSAGKRYFEKLQGHLYMQDGLSGYCRENAEFSLVVFEQIGVLSTIGLCRALLIANEQIQQAGIKDAAIVADGLAALLQNNPISGSPIFDEHVTDITLGMLLLDSTGYKSQAQNWLAELVKRIDYAFKIKRNFPICTDSTDDLVEATVFDDDELRTRLMRTSWLLPTLAAWAVILDRDDLYAVIAKYSKTDYPEICLQLWHPTQDLSKHLYFHMAQYQCGESDAPIHLPDTAQEFRDRMKAILDSPRHNIIESSPAWCKGLPALDFVACRHFRTPVPPFLWFQLLRIDKQEVPKEITPSITL